MAAKRGSAEIDVGDLYRRYYPMVARRVRQFVSHQDVEEVSHEVFLRVIEQAHQFRQESAPVTWLYRLTTNHCLNWVRNLRTRRSLLERFGPGAWPQSHSDPSPEIRTFVHELWRDLDPELAAIGVYFHLDGLTQAEIATMVGCSERTIAYRLKDLETTIRERDQRR
ncbi:MAG: RNA polymerase sigma factor [Myxococcota bacterium]